MAFRKAGLKLLPLGFNLANTVFSLSRCFYSPPETVDTQNYQSFSFHIRLSVTATENASHLCTIILQEVPTYSGYFSWPVANDHAILQDCYSEVILNIVHLT